MYNPESYFSVPCSLLAKERGWVDYGGQTQESDQQEALKVNEWMHTDDVKVKKSKQESASGRGEGGGHNKNRENSLRV